MKYLYSIFSFLLLLATNLHTEDFDVNSLPKLLGSSNAGTEFYFTFVPGIETSCCDLKLYISCNIRTKVTVEVPSKGYTKTKYTIPNEIIEFTLAPAVGQVYRKIERDIPKRDSVWEKAAVHVIADDPIICYSAKRYQYNGSGFLNLPVDILGNEYLISAYNDPGNNTNMFFPAYAGISAVYDNTEIQFIMGGTENSKTSGGLLPGNDTIYFLNKSDVLLISSLGKLSDLSGSRVISSKPISVVTGNFCAFITDSNSNCDITEEMEIPTYAWGETYHVTPIFGRKKNSIIRIYAKKPMTNIMRDGKYLGTIRTAGGIEGVGYLHLRADEGEPRPIVISGDKPISVTQYNPGTTDDSVTSDPFQMTLLPTELYQREIIFHTPGIRGGYGFPYNYINLCYESDIIGNLPDDIEIAFYNYKDSVFEWHRLKDTLGRQGQPFYKNFGDRQFSFTTFLLPGDGVYKIRAEKPFQAYMYGFSSYDSYGMPASVYLDSVKYNDVSPKPKNDFIEIFPNPATDELTIRTNIGFEQESRIEIFDLLGKLLYSESELFRIRTDKKIDLRSFSSGVYYIQISTGKEVFTEKFFVVR
jgi:hypothetical protein